MPEHERNEVCIVEFQNIKERLDKFEETAAQRDDDMKVIEKAIVAIQVANEQTAKTLEKMDAKLELASAKKSTFWTEETKKTAFKYGMIIVVLLIAALLGTNIVEGIQALQSIK